MKNCQKQPHAHNQMMSMIYQIIENDWTNFFRFSLMRSKIIFLFFFCNIVPYPLSINSQFYNFEGHTNFIKYHYHLRNKNQWNVYLSPDKRRIHVHFGHKLITLFRVLKYQYNQWKKKQSMSIPQFGVRLSQDHTHVLAFFFIFRLIKLTSGISFHQSVSRISFQKKNSTPINLD